MLDLQQEALVMVLHKYCTRDLTVIACSTFGKAIGLGVTSGSKLFWASFVVLAAGNSPGDPILFTNTMWKLHEPWSKSSNSSQNISYAGMKFGEASTVLVTALSYSYHFMSCVAKAWLLFSRPFVMHDCTF